MNGNCFCSSSHNRKHSGNLGASATLPSSLKEKTNEWGKRKEPQMRSLAHTFHHHICIVSVFALCQNYASVCVKLNLTRLKGNIGNYEQMPMQRQNESEKTLKKRKKKGNGKRSTQGSAAGTQVKLGKVWLLFFLFHWHSCSRNAFGWLRGWCHRWPI